MLSLILPLLLGCGRGQLPLYSVSIEAAPQAGGAVDVRWEGALAMDAATAWAESADGQRWERDATDGDAVLWGLPSDAELSIGLRFEHGGEEWLWGPQVVRTPPVPTDMPALYPSGDPAAAMDGRLLLTTSVAVPGAAVLIDGAGDVRWWTQLTYGEPISRARLARDGEHVLAMGINNEEDHLPLVRLTLDGREVDRLDLPGQHHDFVEHADGTLAVLVHEWRDVDGVSIAGDRLVEVAPDGAQVEVWSAWDWLPFEGTSAMLEEWDWTHANALVYDEERQLYVVGLLGLQVMVGIDRASGELQWTLGGGSLDFLDEGGEPFVLGRAHQLDLLDGALLYFDNGLPVDQASRSVELAFDPARRVAAERASWQVDPPLYSPTLGDVERLESGDTLTNYGLGGLVVQQRRDGAEVWRLATGIGGAFGYMELLDPARTGRVAD